LKIFLKFSGARKKIMTTKITPEVIRKKELVRYYQSQIFRLNRQKIYLTKQHEKIQAQIKDYQKEKDKTEK